MKRTALARPPLNAKSSAEQGTSCEGSNTVERAGDFYVAKGECITCGAPEAEAPDLMAFDEAAGSCYFGRQPSTPIEVQAGYRAVYVVLPRRTLSRDRSRVQRKLVELGDVESIDVPIGRVTKERAR